MNKIIYGSLISLLIISGCENTEVTEDKNKDKDQKVKKIHAEIADAKPIYEPISKYGNKDYVIDNHKYIIKKDINEHKEIGKASWYGEKIDKYVTSSKEKYDKLAMSAAHPTLPIPSYVKVTNLENKKTTIVRINDRGPFKKEAIIDLSYAAASKLDMLEKGTAKVSIELIKINNPENKNGLYVQVFATKKKSGIKEIGDFIKKEINQEAHVVQSGDLHLVRLGPFKSKKEAKIIKMKTRKIGYHDSYIIKR